MISSYRALLSSFRQYISLILKDAMLILIGIAPILCGLFFKYAVPFIQSLLKEQLGISELLTPYYLVFDLMLIVLTPLLFSFASAYLILGEIDEGISKYMAVTPLGKKGYLLSRLGFGLAISTVVAIVITSICALSDLTLSNITSVSLLSAFLGLIEALLIVALSGNRVEGMALSKISGLLLLGIPAPFFILGKAQYILFFLPSFWVAKFAMERDYLYFIICLLVSFIWIGLLYQRFQRKTL
jgi:fluoroquinolone transport system permease protein